jgi:deoxyadenosine/deoxycytidine kinase
MFYKDPKRWAFTFQTYAFLSRTQAAVQQLRAGDAEHHALAAAAAAGSHEGGGEALSPPPSYVFERSLYSDKHCFATNCFKTGLFNQAEWTVYNDYHAFIMVIGFGGAMPLHTF